MIWSPVSVADSELQRFISRVNDLHGGELRGYRDVWEWSTEQPGEFWAAIWSQFALGAPQSVTPEVALAWDGRDVSSAVWFQGCSLNFAEKVMRAGADDAVAIVEFGEDGHPVEITWAQLRDQVARLAGHLESRGLKTGDVAAAYLPNIGEAITAFLACASLGITWSVVGQDYSPIAAAARFAQLDPVVLFTCDETRFNGHQADRRADIDELVSSLPTLTDVLIVERRGEPSGIEGAVSFASALVGEHRCAPRSVPFETPLWVLFSSGTTGKPKGLVHSHGGIALELTKLFLLQWELTATDRFFWYTSPSWVLWAVTVGSLIGGGSAVCYAGAPMHPTTRRLWQIAGEVEATVLGVSPGYLERCEDDGVDPREDADLSAVRILGTTGSPLQVRSSRYLERVLPGVPVFSTSGGTDVVGPFVTGSPATPVWEGEIPVRALGVAAEVWDDSGRPVRGEVGELVVTRPMPSMPASLWDDPGGDRLQETYFSTYPGVWRQGDWATLTERDTVLIHGRSDATLNRHGVRLGPAEIYRVVEELPEILEALVIGMQPPGQSYRIPLFVTLAPGVQWSGELAARVRDRIASRLSRQHVPDSITPVAHIPHTKTGKKLEVPVKRFLEGMSVDRAFAWDVVDDVGGTRDFIRSASALQEVGAASSTPK